MIKAVIFDSDGMLSHGRRFSDTYAKEHGISIDEMTPFFSGPFQDCLVGKADLKEELKKGWMEKWNWHSSVEELIEYWFSTGDQLDHSVFDTVTQLRGNGILCVIATNQEKCRTDYLSNKFGYTKAFDRVFSSAYVGSKKTSTEFLNVVFDFLREQDPSVQKNEVLFWDDRSEHIEKVKQYGFEARQFSDAAQYHKEMVNLSLLK